MASQISQLILKIAATLTNALDLSTPEDALSRDYTLNLGDGNGANQANQVFHDQRTLAASASEELDLSGGLTNGLGQSVTFTKLKLLLIKAAAGNTNDVLVGGASLNGFIAPFGDATDVIKVKPGGTLLLVAPDANGYAVTAGTADLLKIANSGAGSGVTYDIVAIGVQ